MPSLARVAVLAVAVSLVVTVGAQTPGPSAAPRNDLPQPYRTTRDWGQLPPGVKWAAVTAVEPAPDGTIYVIHRCFANSCAGRTEAPILKYDADGKLLKSWGEGMFIFPHGATVDRQGNLWVTDARGENGKGHQVFKFSPDGKVLMTLGKAGVSGSGPDLFDQPNDVLVGPNGDIFVADSHRNGKNNRIVKFTRDGKFIKEWGSKGSGPGQISEPHTIAMDFTRPPVCRRSREQPDPDLRSGREHTSPSGGSSAGRAASPSRLTTRSTSPIPSRVPTAARTNCPASRRVFASAARRTAPFRRSSRTWNRPPAIIPAPKASAWMPRATCMAPSFAVRCSSGT